MSERVIKNLRCDLTDAEKLTKAQELAALNVELARLEDEKALVGRRFGEQIKELKLRGGMVTYDVQSGTEERPVEVRERISDDPALKLVFEIYRADTGETIGTRPMTRAEQQLKLKLDDDALPVPEDEEDDDQSQAH